MLIRINIPYQERHGVLFVGVSASRDGIYPLHDHSTRCTMRAMEREREGEGERGRENEQEEKYMVT
jgi:hypothetical protein